MKTFHFTKTGNGATNYMDWTVNSEVNLIGNWFFQKLKESYEWNINLIKSWY